MCQGKQDAVDGFLGRREGHRCGSQQPGQVWRLLAGTGRALGKRLRGPLQELAPQHFLTHGAEKCWHRLGEQPGLCEQTQELERRFLVATVDVWEKKMCVCLINIGTQQELIS